MINILIFVIAFAIPIAILFVGMVQSDFAIVKSGFSLLFFFYCAFIGACIREMKSLSINRKRLSYVVALFFCSVLLIAIGGIFDLLTYAAVLAGVFGFIAIVILLRS